MGLGFTSPPKLNLMKKPPKTHRRVAPPFFPIGDMLTGLFSGWFLLPLEEF